MSTSHLRAVDTEPTRLSPSGLPDFEGEPVDFARLRLSAAGDLEGPEMVRIDDVVRLYVEGRVTRVDHVLDEKTGRLKRVHTVKIVDAITVPTEFDSGVFDG